MIADLVVSGITDGDQRGVFARRPLPTGLILDWFCQRCTVLARTDELWEKPRAERDALLEHCYSGSDGLLVLDCTVGRYMNHACAANVLESPDGFDVVVEPVDEGEELRCDYRQYVEPADAGFRCRCGSPSCAGWISAAEVPSDRLNRQWRERANRALVHPKLAENYITGIGNATRSVGTFRIDDHGVWQRPAVGPRSPTDRKLIERLASARTVSYVPSAPAERPAGRLATAMSRPQESSR